MGHTFFLAVRLFCVDNLLQQTPTNVQLHDFSNAFQSAYAAVIYVRSVYPNGDIETRFVASKTKIAPINPQSIPHLKLLGALLLAQLFDTVYHLSMRIFCRLIQ